MSLLQNEAKIGRGRAIGRGRGNNTSAIKTESGLQRYPWTTPMSSGPTRKRESNGNVSGIASNYAVNESDNIRERMVKIAEKYSNLEETDSEEELEDSEILEISSKTTKQYEDALQDVKESFNNSFLHDVLQAGGAVSCLVCIETIKRPEAIWNCSQCYCIFHLPCIQKWARESIGRQVVHSDEILKPQDLLWNCPKCRYEYKQSECPTKYICYCGKEEDPSPDPWTVPHSCGQQCERKLKPECGHLCLLLCHPGPCPPCPKTVQITCFCGKCGPNFKRCSMKGWSCKRKCEKSLGCRNHTCQEICHKEACPPCPMKSIQLCLCGKKEDRRPCSEPEWSCKQMCGKELTCGHHVCEKVCHSGLCGACPRSGTRKCPCGKTKSMLPCTEDVSSCEDTCMKDLSCGLHKCSKRCHYGSCDACLHVIEKTCRCGKRTKEIPCSQLFLCDWKCAKPRSCERHPCKKKCCDGKCPPCEQICNRTLNCRNHKCQSICHPGPCYPCPLSQKVQCRCKKSFNTVPCGREKTARPPRCKEMCQIPPDCHHENRKPHYCHFGRCSACQYTCNKKLACQHSCQEICHDYVVDKEATKQNEMRTSGKKAQDVVFVSLPCPPCQSPVEMLCFGEHVKELFPCTSVKPYSCKRPCGRLLPCENHTCQRECHVVKGHPLPKLAGKNCYKCEEMCLKPRPDGCIHDCRLSCHPGPCQVCEVYLKLNCFCKTIQLYLKCSEFNQADEASKNLMLSCKGRCPKLKVCGHLCSKFCHTGDCSEEDSCEEMTKIKCPCGRRKKGFSCREIRSASIKLDCDERCQEVNDKKRQAIQEHEEILKEAELLKQKEELEKFERKKQGRKRKQRQIHETDKENGTLAKYRLWIVTSAIFMLIAAYFMFLYL